MKKSLLGRVLLWLVLTAGGAALFYLRPLTKDNALPSSEFGGLDEVSGRPS